MNEIDVSIQELSIGNQKCNTADDDDELDDADDDVDGNTIPINLGRHKNAESYDEKENKINYLFEKSVLPLSPA